LWQAGDPWNRSACLLFPAICRHTGDVIRAEEATGSAGTWPMPKHGLARDLGFTVLEQEETRAVLELVSSPATLAAYPWDFTLRVEYALEDATATLRFTVTNTTTGDHGAGTTMPYALGWHPAFAWPLPGTADDAVTAGSEDDSPPPTAGVAAHPTAQDSTAQDAPVHVVEFESPTPQAFHRLADDLLVPQQRSTVDELGAAGSLVPLRRSHFEESAVLFPDVADTAIVYRRLDREGPRVRIAWERFDTLTLWSAPGGDFVCLEPWAGRPQESGSTTPDAQRADLQHLEAGASRTHVCRITVAAGS
jgi:galactose mutarotase-like enzyme